MIYVLAHNYNSSHWQDIPEVFTEPYTNRRGDLVNTYEEVQKIIRDNCQSKHPEVFIKHYKEKYDTPTNPPSWMFMELLTIGELSRLYVGLRQNKDKQDIATFFALPHSVFASWIHTLTYVRNICAHHSRLWNREFAIKPDILIKPKKMWVVPLFDNNQRTFYFLCTLKYLLWGANPNNHLSNKIDLLIKKHPNIPVRFMGIPSDKDGVLADWRNEALWI